MGRRTAWLLTLLSLALTAGCLLGLLTRPPALRHVDPTPLGAPGAVLQGPLAVGRAFLVPYRFMELKARLFEGRYGRAQKAARRLLVTAPWLVDVWIRVAWVQAFAPDFDELTPGEKAARLLKLERWLDLGARVLPRDASLPLTLAFLLSHRLPPGTPADRAWTALTGRTREAATLHWLAEARRRDPRDGRVTARTSAVVVDMAAKAWRRGDLQECADRLTQGLALERRLAARGSLPAREWVAGLERLLALTRRPHPWPAAVRAEVRGSSPGLIFLRAAGGSQW